MSIPSPHRHRRGFTLIEMIITLCVFTLLAASVFGIFDATLQGVASLEDEQKRENRADALNAWLRREFAALPADGIIASYHQENSPFRASDLAWGRGGNLQALDLHAQPNGLYELRLARFVAPANSGAEIGTQAAFDIFARQLLGDGPAPAWRTLLRDLVSATWRFRAGNSLVWQDMTSGDQQTVVEFTYRRAGSSTAVTGDYWIPPLTRASNLVTSNAGVAP